MSKAKFTLFILSFACLFSLNEAFAQDENKTKKFSIEDESEFEIYSDTNAEQIYDPLEKYNRKIFAFNDFLDRHFLEYAAKTYRGVPKPARNSIRNFLNNLSAPISTFNSILQGKTENSLANFSNFLINSTIGIGGLFNVAEEKGIRYKEEDFGQTLGHYGIKSGAYLMVPFVGPSSVRDFAGTTTDQIISPASYNIFKIGGKTYLIGQGTLYVTTALSTVDARERLLEIVDDARRDSFDLYATLRSAYIQRRISEIQN